MDHLLALLAPLAVLLPGVTSVTAPVEQGPLADRPAVEEQLTPQAEPVADAPLGRGWIYISESFRPPVENQVRIEQRITIRISPRGAAPPPAFFDLPNRLPPRMNERHMGRCLPISGIAGVQVAPDNRLVLFLRDRRMVSLGLEKTCSARDFYSGFYVERNGDGQLCVDRDRLQSRSGANCALTRMRQLINPDE